MITDEQIRAWREICDKAFRAPWVASTWEVACPDDEACCGDAHDCETIESPDEYPDGQVVAQVDDHGCISTPGLEGFAKANSIFIAAARTVVPALIDEVERLGHCCIKTQARQAGKANMNKLFLMFLFFSACDTHMLVVSPDDEMMHWHDGAGERIVRRAAGWWCVVAPVSVKPGGTQIISRHWADRVPAAPYVAAGDRDGIEVDLDYWSDTGQTDGFRSQIVAHEIGHALGMSHVDDPRAIMFHAVHDNDWGTTDADVREYFRVHSAE